MLLAAAKNADLDDFYRTVSALCFTLLGLWWVVGQVRYQEWVADPRRRRQAYAVSLYFLLPGVMMMLSAINADLSTLWRVAFGLAAVVGLVEVGLYATTAAIRTTGATVLHVCSFVLYLLIALFAIKPTLAMDMGLGLAPREAEAILVSFVIVVGVNLAWFGLTAPIRSGDR
jgi:hypothetical protein